MGKLIKFLKSYGMGQERVSSQMPVNMCHEKRLFYLLPADGTTILWVMSNWPCRLAIQDIMKKDCFIYCQQMEQQSYGLCQTGLVD